MVPGTWYLGPWYLDSRYLASRYLDPWYLDPWYLDSRYLGTWHLGPWYLDSRYLDSRYLGLGEPSAGGAGGTRWLGVGEPAELEVKSLPFKKLSKNPLGLKLKLLHLVREQSYVEQTLERVICQNEN